MRQSRARLGLNQVRFAALLDVSPATVSRWERGRLGPSAAAWRRIEASRFGGTATATAPPATPAPAPVGRSPGPANSPAGGRAGPTNLPAELTSFVGRDDDTRAVARLLAVHRLVCLTGPGGCGKTRLALAVARQLPRRYRGGVWLVELAGVSDPALVAHATASALGVREQRGAPLLTELTARCGRHPTLIVLDNCEHMVDSVAEFVASMLRALPDLQMLITSRERLGSRWEQTWAVSPLATPDRDHLPLDQLGGYAALRLFVERARAVQPLFALTEANAAHVAQICRRLDGLPLAIELAAARLTTMSIRQIAARIGDRLALLVGSARGTASRHRTMRAAVDWSFALLGEVERRLFRRLAVFAGTFDLAAVAAVASETAETVEPVLEQLVAKSLVLAEEHGGAVRFRLLETLRSHARERLDEAGEAGETERHHVAHFTAVARQAAAVSLGPNHAAGIACLERDHANLRLALQRAGPADRLALSALLWGFWLMRGHLGEGRSWLARALAETAPPDTSHRAAALHGAGVLANAQGDFASAEALLSQSLTLYRVHGDERASAGVLTWLGVVAFESGDYDRMERFAAEADGIARRVGDRLRVAHSAICLGLAALFRGEFAAARVRFLTARAEFEGVGGEAGVATSIANLGAVAYAEGDLAAAEAAYLEALRIERRLGWTSSAGMLFDRLGHVARRRRDFGAARRLLRRSLHARAETGVHHGQIESLGSFADLAAEAGDAARAARLFGAFEAHADRAGVPLLPIYRDDRRRLTEAVRAALGPARFAEEREAGRSLSLVDALVEARSFDVGSQRHRDASGTAPAQFVFGGRGVRGAGGPHLTPRECEVFELLAGGLSARRIAERLGISVRTVERHTLNLYAKLGVDNRSAAVAALSQRPRPEGAAASTD